MFDEYGLIELDGVLRHRELTGHKNCEYHTQYPNTLPSLLDHPPLLLMTTRSRLDLRVDL